MTSPYQPPRSIRAQGRPSLDQVRLRRALPPTDLLAGVFTEAWEWVKKRPVETLLLSLLTLIFDGGCRGNYGDWGEGVDSEPWGGPVEGPAEDPSGLLLDLRAVVDGLLPSDILAADRGSIFDSLGSALDEPAVIIGIVAVALVIGLVLWVLGTFLSGGANIFWLRLVRGEAAEFGHIGQAWPCMVPLLLSSLLAGLAFVAGFVALIIPGIIIALGFWFVSLVIVDKNLGPVDGLRASWRLVDGYKGDLLLLAILTFFLNLLGLLLCCVGLIPTNAVAMGAVVIVYNRLAEPTGAYLKPHERGGTEPVSAP